VTQGTITKAMVPGQKNCLNRNDFLVIY